MAENELLKIVEIKPDIYYYEAEGRILQLLQLTIENFQTEKPYEIIIRFKAVEFHQSIGKVKIGEGTYKIGMPDLQEAVDVTFEIASKGKVYASKTMTWTPQRHWEVHLVQFAHHDLGYTDLPSNILDDYLTYFDDVIRYCEETKDLPEAAQFSYTVETTWSILHFLKNSTQEKIDSLIKLIKAGRVEVCALPGNQITEISGSEELVRLLFPAFQLKKKYGIPIRSAMLNDIPGMSWGLASVLAEAGIRYFSPAFPSYFSWGNTEVHSFWDEKTILPNGAPDAFYWETITGEKILVWHGVAGAGGIVDPALPNLAEQLINYEKQGYPYGKIRLFINGAKRDNAPPNRAFCDTVKKWNETWVWPKLVLSTNIEFFEQLEKELPGNLRTFRGELPGTDYPVGATCMARELAINRQNQQQLGDAEKFAAIASAITDYRYPDKALQNGFLSMALFDEHTFGQFHPIGPAQNAEAAEKKVHAYRAAALADNVTQMSLNRIADQIKLADDEYYLIVFNPLPFPRTDVVFAELAPNPPTGLPLSNAGTDSNSSSDKPKFLICNPLIGRQLTKPPIELIDSGFDLIDAENGNNEPYQINEITSPLDPMPEAAHRYALGQKEPLYARELMFVARDVPALGYKCYRLKPSPKKAAPKHSLDQSGRTIENKFYKIVIALNSGGLFSIYDKELECDLVDGFAKYRINQIFVRSAKTQRINILENIAIRKEQRGSVGLSLVITGQMEGCPKCVQEITIYNDLKRIDFTNRVVKDSTPLQEIYFAFPFAVKEPKFHYESGLSVIEPLKDAFPGAHSDANAVQSWVSISDGEKGITWTSIDAPIVRIGGLWPGYVSQAHHLLPPENFGRDFAKPDELNKAHLYSLVMTGNYQTNFDSVQITDMLFRYSITSHKGDWKTGPSQEFGWSHASKLNSLFMRGPQPGKPESAKSFAQVEPKHVLLLALKRAEDNADIIARFWETRGEQTEVMFSLNIGTIKEAWKTNLEEEILEEVVADEGSVIFNIEAFQLVTIRFRLET